MSDLISRDMALKALYTERQMETEQAFDAISPGMVFDIAIMRIKKLPAVDAEPVRHGRWMKVCYDPAWTKCSECRCHWEWETVVNCNVSYCPNCGSKMMDGDAT